MWIPRHLETELKRSALARPIVVVAGTSQTGKTALVRHAFPKHAFVSLKDAAAAEMAGRDPGAFLSGLSRPLIVDGVQHAPGLLTHLVAEVERNRGRMGHLILTATLPCPELKTVAAESPGLVSVLRLGGLSASELREAGIAMSAEKLLLRGGFPELHARPELRPHDFFFGHVAQHIEKFRQANLRLVKMNELERVMGAIARRTALPVNRSELARELGMSPPTAASRLSILAGAGLLSFLEPWPSLPHTYHVKSPKLHVGDTGLACYWLGLKSEADVRECPYLEALWESRVYHEITARMDAGEGGQASLLFWQDRYKGADFLLQRNGKIHLAEARWSEAPESTAELDRVRTEFTPAPPLTVFCRTPQRHRLSAHALALPLAEVADWLNGKAH